jgi:hypothetical protein
VEVWKGSIDTNVIWVMYYPGSLGAKALPKKAILILKPEESINHQISAEYFFALGKDGYRGILPDTAENRRRIADLRLPQLIGTPESDWLPREKAYDIVREAVMTRFGNPDGSAFHFFADRYDFGWDIIVFVGPPTHYIAIVGDDGLLKNITPGL